MRRLGLIVAAGLFGLSLAACGANGSSGSEQPAVTEPGVTSSSAPGAGSSYGGSGVPYGSSVDKANDTAADAEARNEELEQMGGP
jgi:hypothetical protein